MVLCESLNVEPKVSSPPLHKTSGLYISVFQHMVNIFLTSKCTQAIRCLCFISYEKPRGVKLSKGVSVGSGCNLKLQEMEVRKSNEIMREGTMKEASQVVIKVTKFVNTGRTSSV